jgi:hypothetical protein
VLSTNQRGLVAETAVVHRCVLLGVGVSKPIDDEKYDLVLDLRPRLLRVQCKFAHRIGDVICARLYTSRGGREGLINRKYTTDEIDAFAIYCTELDRCYLLPAEDFVAYRQVHLRVAPSRNNQLTGIRWAQDFELGATLRRLQGPIAQLGERRHGMPKAAGSSPAGSTSRGRAAADDHECGGAARL